MFAKLITTAVLLVTLGLGAVQAAERGGCCKKLAACCTGVKHCCVVN